MAIYITITGTCHYYGQEFMEAGMVIHLIKEPDNEHDREAIRAEMDGLGKIGYVANSPHTVLGESYSAGRLYDKISDTADARILYVLPRGLLCTVNSHINEGNHGDEHATDVDENSIDEHTITTDTIDADIDQFEEAEDDCI